MITFKSNFNAKRLSEEVKRRAEDALKKSLLEASSEIKIRTRRGTDANGKAFEKYSDGYKKRKQAATGRGGTVDLTGFTYRTKNGHSYGGPGGEMLRAITYTVERVADGILGKIFFNSELEAKKAYWNMIDNGRRFFELSKEQFQKIKLAIDEAMKK